MLRNQRKKSKGPTFGPLREDRDQVRDLEPLRGYPGASDIPGLAALDREIQSNEAFDRAIAAYSAQDYATAAQWFMAAAEPILVQRTDFNGQIMAENRLACYANARRAWRLAGGCADARVALLAAATRDDENGEAIQKLVAGLDAP
jgi:hypothetical protein